MLPYDEMLLAKRRIVAYSSVKLSIPGDNNGYHRSAAFGISTEPDLDLSILSARLETLHIEQSKSQETLVNKFEGQVVDLTTEKSEEEEHTPSDDTQEFKAGSAPGTESHDEHTPENTAEDKAGDLAAEEHGE
jgi:hypothetical protein